MSILRISQLRTISCAASAGMMPRRPCTIASAFSISTYFAVRFSSDQTRRIASVLKMSPKMDESMIVADMAENSPEVDSKAERMGMSPRVSLRSRGRYLIVTVASIVSQPSWSRAHRWNDLSSAVRSPQTWK